MRGAVTKQAEIKDKRRGLDVTPWERLPHYELRKVAPSFSPELRGKATSLLTQMDGQAASRTEMLWPLQSFQQCLSFFRNHSQLTGVRGCPVTHLVSLAHRLPRNAELVWRGRHRAQASTPSGPAPREKPVVGASRPPGLLLDSERCQTEFSNCHRDSDVLQHPRLAGGTSISLR